MLLSPGTRLGPYEILALLGAGGMGEVYRARDTKLNRDVALKILPATFAGNPERMSRFQREAQVLASLNHPNIAAIYGLEESAGARALVMELVEGSTLSERIRQRAMPADAALPIARQIAEALETAHEKGIIHRDLKPDNIKITPEGKVKVLDFGLAKAMDAGASSSPDLSRSPTISAEGTKAGVILGTAGYMSPEQARGKPVDKRTDVWAFGCVLYELLAGRRAFPGETLSDCVAAILGKEPEWDALPASTPRQVQALVRRCLQKDLQKRLRDIGDARIELEDLLAAPAQEEPARKQIAMNRRTVLSALAGAAAGATGVGIFGLSRWRNATPRSLTRFNIPLPEGTVAEVTANRRVAISPDGTHIAYNVSAAGQGTNITAQKFYLQSLSELEPKLLPAVGGAPFFSPDGLWLGFFGPGPSGNALMRKVSLSGGAPVNLCTLEGFMGTTWADDDTIYFVAAVPGGVMRVPASGGQPQEAAKIDFAKGERMHRYPCALPGGKAVLFTVSTPDTDTFDDALIAVLNTETGQRRTLVEGGTHPRYSPSGHLVYARGGNLLAVRFDAKRLKVIGQPLTVLEGVLMSVNNGVANYDISASGDLIYVPGISDKGARTLVWVDRNGKPEPLPLPPRSYLHPRISPDMRQLAIEIEGPNHDFYIYDFTRGVLSKMTTDGVSHWPVWSPDGRQLVYRSGPMGKFKLWHVPADRSHPSEQVPATGVSQSAESWSPDGSSIAYTAVTPGVPPSIMVAHLEGGSQAQLFASGKAPEGSPKFSPDGRWLSYCSNESGKAQVYVQAFPGPGPKIQVSNDGGTDPVWKRTGGELYFRDGDKMMAVAVSTAPTFTAGRPQRLWEGHYSHGMSTSCGPPGATSSNYDVTADGRRFLMIKDEAPDTAFSRQMIVVLGWSDELARMEKSKSGQT